MRVLTEFESRSLQTALTDVNFFTPVYHKQPTILKPKMVEVPGEDFPVMGIRLYWSQEHITAPAPFIAMLHPVQVDNFSFHFGKTAEQDVIVYEGVVYNHDFEVYSLDHVRNFFTYDVASARERILRAVTGNILTF